MVPLANSADCHVMEPHDLWTRALPPALRDLGPRVEVDDKRMTFLAEGRVVRRFPLAAGEVDPFGSETADPARRLADLDADGVWAEVMYPNVAFFCCYAVEDAALQAASCRVYNDWVRERFLATSPRFVPAAILPILDPAAAVAELERTRRAGFRAMLLPAHADHAPYNDRRYDRLWATAADLGAPLSFHIGTGRSQTPAHGPGAAVVNYVVTVSGALETLSYLCAAGILAAHPALRVVLVECGSGWLAWALEAMDDAYRGHDVFVTPKLELLPSEYFRRQGHVTFQRDPVGLRNLPFTGDRCLLWGSDYPHPEGTFPRSREVLAEQLAGLAPDVVERIVYGNSAELYAIAPPP